MNIPNMNLFWQLTMYTHTHTYIYKHIPTHTRVHNSAVLIWFRSFLIFPIGHTFTWVASLLVGGCPMKTYPKSDDFIHYCWLSVFLGASLLHTFLSTLQLAGFYRSQLPSQFFFSGGKETGNACQITNESAIKSAHGIVLL